MNPAPPVGAIQCSTVQQRTEFGTTELTEHTEWRAQDIKASFPCVPCIPWLAKMNPEARNRSLNDSRGEGSVHDAST